MARLQIILALILQALYPCARCESIACGGAACPPGLTCASEPCIAQCFPAAPFACCAATCDASCGESTPVPDEAPSDPTDDRCDPSCIALLCRFVPTAVVTRTDARTSGDAELDRALDALHASWPTHPQVTIAAPSTLASHHSLDPPPWVARVSRPVICVWIN